MQPDTEIRDRMGTQISLSLFLKMLFIMKDTQERGRDTDREKPAPCREPNGELDPRTPGSHPELKADAQPLSHPGAPQISFHTVCV